MARARRRRSTASTATSTSTSAKSTRTTRAGKAKKMGRGRRSATAIDIGSFSVKIVSLVGDDAGTVDIRKVTIIPLAEPEGHEYPEEKLNRQREALKEAVKKHGRLEGQIVLGCPRNLATVRYLTLPSGNREELREMLMFDVERHVPFPPDELEISFQVIEKVGEHESKLMLVCVPRREINPYAEMCLDLNVKIDVIDLDILGACAAYERSLSPEETVALLDFGRSSVKLGILQNGTLLFSRSLPVTESRLLEGFSGAKSWRDLQGRITAAGALHPAEREHFSEWVDRLSMELLRSVSAFGSEHNDKRIDRMILFGGAGYFPAGPPRGLNVKIKTKTTIESAMNGELPSSDDYRGTELSTPVGLALRGLQPVGNKLNLLPEDVINDRIYKQRTNFRKNIAMLLFMIVILLGAAGWVKWYDTYLKSTAVNEYYKTLAKDTNQLETKRKKISSVENYLDKKQSAVIVIKDVLEMLTEHRAYVRNITFHKRDRLEISGQVLNEDAIEGFLTELANKDYIDRMHHSTNTKTLDLGAVRNFSVLEFSISCRLDDGIEDRTTR